MHKKTTRKEVVYKKIGWAAYPSYQVPFRERRVPFLLVNFPYYYSGIQLFVKFYQTT